jgi:hypothetical protein
MKHAGSVKSPENWHEPASALEFIVAYDELLALLHQDQRVDTD